MTCPAAARLSEDLRAAALVLQPHQDIAAVMRQQQADPRYQSALTRYKMHRRRCEACRERRAELDRIAERSVIIDFDISTSAEKRGESERIERWTKKPKAQI